MMNFEIADDIQIIDNLLPQEEFDAVRATFLGDSPSRKLKWIISEKNSVETEDPINFQDTTDLYNYHFVHMFYYNKEHFVSDEFNSIVPIIQRMNVSALVKVKANLQPATPKTVLHPFHIDIQKFNGRTAIYYVNSNDGFTMTEYGHKIESVANRLVIFNSKMKHAGSTCTDKRFRCVINFNYYTWEM